MGGTADMIRYINVDELSHVRLFQKLVKEGMKVFPYSKKWIIDFFFEAVQQEIKWNKHIIGNQVLGITYDSIEQYSCYLANIRLKAIGLEPMFEGVKNPYKHLEKIADTKAEASVKTNFFDATVTSYQQSSVLDGWEDI